MTAPVRRRRRRLLSLPVLGVLALVLAGCVSLPTDGPVVDSDAIDAVDTRRASDIDARPPSAGASRSEVVSGFLDAMTAWPVQINVAKKYLTEEAAGRWNPERETVVYSDAPLAIREAGESVQVRLGAADALDGAGAWRGALSGDALDLSLRLTVEDGEFRIADPADALVVPASWFQQRYRQVSLYYFDPIAQILVPEPVFVPQGDQLATSLVSGLLEGPPPRARGVVRSFVPRGLSVGLSVPVDDRGIADINLVGDGPRLTAEEAELMLAQLAWTLRQDPAITALRVSIGGESLPIPGGASQFPVDGGQAFDPAGDEASTLLFGLARGRLVWGSSGNLVTATGPFGDPTARLEAVAARPDATEAVAAAVDAGGHRVRVAPVRGNQGTPAVARTVLSGGTYARPSWDFAGRLWVLDQRRSGARVLLLEDGRVREMQVDGISGRSARALVVSRDGTRLVGVVRTANGDEVVGARVVISGRGRVSGTRSPFLIRGAEGTAIADLAWTSPIRVGLLTATAPGSLYEVDVVAADGASVGVDVLSTIVSGRLIGVAAAPSAGTSMFAVYADRYVDMVDQEEYVAGAPLTQLDYAG
ncbi:MAG TPA: LpqB family beta-propeller domain-containing protein [Nocardioides sp.]|nr:LpqB family beta-propeller domain-containing protein [Nocardioides sp.]